MGIGLGWMIAIFGQKKATKSYVQFQLILGNRKL